MAPTNPIGQPPIRKSTFPAGPRLPATSLFCAGALLLGAVLAMAPRSSEPGDPGRWSTLQPGNPSATGPPERTAPGTERLREGTELVAQPGTFRVTGDRITFFTDFGGGRFIVLENLALERVGLAIGDHPDPSYWRVDGTVTEYGGENFLLIRRAVRRGAF